MQTHAFHTMECQYSILCNGFHTVDYDSILWIQLHSMECLYFHTVQLIPYYGFKIPYYGFNCTVWNSGHSILCIKPDSYSILCNQDSTVWKKYSILWNFIPQYGIFGSTDVGPGPGVALAVGVTLLDYYFP